jgi:hypothetical protein
VEIYHRHNLRTSRDGGKFAVAVAMHASIVGVAIVGNPLSASFMDGFTAEVLRACVLPEAPPELQFLPVWSLSANLV